MTGVSGVTGVARTGAVYDRGYRPYEGARGGRRAATLAIYRASLRRAVGLRRSWRQKFLPLGLLAIVTVPAAVNVGIGYATRNSPLEGFEFFTYREYVGVSSSLLFFVAACAPDVLCPDRRQRVLPLLFARPLTGADYVVAKLGAIFSVLFAFSFLPQVLLFVGQMLVSNAALDYVRDNAPVLWQVPVSVTALALYYAALGLALASLTSRRVVAGATILGLTLVASAVSGILREAGSAAASGAVDLLGLPLYVRDLVFLGHIDPTTPLSGVEGGGAMALGAYLAVVTASVGLLLWRYRWAER
jgi:ABC-2 type transport system permease protein